MLQIERPIRRSKPGGREVWSPRAGVSREKGANLTVKILFQMKIFDFPRSTNFNLLSEIKGNLKIIVIF